MKSIAIVCGLALSITSGESVADTAPTDSVGDNLIVYGVRIDQAETEVGSSVFVITADDISVLGADFLVDAIATAPGVTINQNGSYGGTASVRIRGASSQQTLVIVDGVVVNDPSSPGGGFDFARIDPAVVDRIEILRGPQSTLWGTDAMGGVVNIITKKASNGIGGDAFVQTGSFATRRGGASVYGGSDNINYRLSAVHNSTDGISKADEADGNAERDPYESSSVSAITGVNLGSLRLQASILWSKADADFDSFVFGAPGNVADGDEMNTTEELAANLTLKMPLLYGRFDNVLTIGFSGIDRQSFAAGTATFGSEGDRRSLRYQGTVTINDNNRIAFGAEHDNTDAGGADTSTDGLFALYEFHPMDELTLTAGLRRDDHDVYGNETTRRLALAYNPTDQITVRASWGEGFKAPTLFQTTFFCCGAGGPNLNLRPETSSAYDVGFSIRSGDARARIGVTYFDQDTSNLIDFSFGIGGYENIAAARSTGIEVDGGYKFNEWLETALSFAYIDATDGNGVTLVRVPDRTADVSLNLNSDGRLSGSLFLRYNGEEHDPNGVVAAWTRVDLSGRYAVSDTVDVYARVENLFDRQYQQIIGYGTPGISAYLGARVRF